LYAFPLSRSLWTGVATGASWDRRKGGKPVSVKLDKQNVNANTNKLDIIDGGDVIRFTGGVSMIVQPN
jgi:hypothetical protein